MDWIIIVRHSLGGGDDGSRGVHGDGVRRGDYSTVGRDRYSMDRGCSLSSDRDDRFRCGGRFRNRGLITGPWIMVRLWRWYGQVFL